MSFYVPQQDERPNNDGQHMAEDLQAEHELNFDDMQFKPEGEHYRFTDTLTLS